MTKYTKEKVEKTLKNNNFILLDQEYESFNKRMNIQDVYGYKYFASLHYLLKKHNLNKFSSNNSFAIENIKLWIKINNKKFTLASKEYTNSKSKLNFICSICNNNFYSAMNHILHDNTECPYCSGTKASVNNNLKIKYPKLASEFDSIKNNTVPEQILPHSNKKYWWICNDCKYEWYASVNGRTSKTRTRNCPCCVGKIPTNNNNFAIINPELLIEWNNKNIKNPNEYLPSSHKKVWWKCKDCDYEWEASLANRSKGRGCPICGISLIESKIATYIKKYCLNIFPNDAIIEDKLIINSKTNRQLSFDVYIHSINLAVEINGSQHYDINHIYYDNKRKFEDYKYRDNIKKEWALQHGYYLEIDLRKIKTKEQSKKLLDKYIFKIKEEIC